MVYLGYYSNREWKRGNTKSLAPMLFADRVFQVCKFTTLHCCSTVPPTWQRQLLHTDWRHCGATENARPDIARLDNSAPYRKGGSTSRDLFHCASISSIQVNICCREYYELRIGCMCVVLLNSVQLSCVASYSYVRQTKWAVCVISVWEHY